MHSILIPSVVEYFEALARNVSRPPVFKNILFLHATCWSRYVPRRTCETTRPTDKYLSLQTAHLIHVNAAFRLEDFHDQCQADCDFRCSDRNDKEDKDLPIKQRLALRDFVTTRECHKR